jgi:hypothetical protein
MPSWGTATLRMQINLPWNGGGGVMRTSLSVGLQQYCCLRPNALATEYLQYMHVSPHLLHLQVTSSSTSYTVQSANKKIDQSATYTLWDISFLPATYQTWRLNEYEDHQLLINFIRTVAQQPKRNHEQSYALIAPMRPFGLQL